LRIFSTPFSKKFSKRQTLKPRIMETGYLQEQQQYAWKVYPEKVKNLTVGYIQTTIKTQ